MTESAKLTSPILGVNVDRVVSSASAINREGFELGKVVHGKDNSRWMAVTAGSAVTAYDCVAVDENFECHPITKARADDGHFIGFAQMAFAISQYGWVAMGGSNIKCRVGASCAADVKLYTTSTAGVLDDTSTSQTQVQGAAGVTAGSAGGVTAVEVIATYPRSVGF